MSDPNMVEDNGEANTHPDNLTARHNRVSDYHATETGKQTRLKEDDYPK